MDSSRSRDLALGVAAGAAVVAIAIAQLWPGLSAGLSPPISWDHGAHLAKAALTAEELFPFLRGWTDLVEAGVPQHTLYTPAGTIWILIFRIFTPHLEWHQTYAVAFAGFRALVGLTAFRLARVAGAGRVAAVLAGAFALADWGDHSEGGWFYDVIFGVWPMGLAMCVFFFGFADLLVYLERGGRAAGTRAALLLGVALFAHQASLLAVGSIVPALLIFRAIERGELRRDVGRIVFAFAIAGLIAAWWMLPMFAHTDWLDDHCQLYRSPRDIGAAIVEGRAILNGGPWTGALVTLALLTGLFARGHRRVLAGGAMLAMLISTPGWLLELDMHRWLPSLGRIAFPRMMMIAKPLCFALVGCLLHDLWTRARPAVHAMLASGRGRVGLAVTALVVAPFATGAPEKLAEILVRRDVTYTSTLPDWEDRRDTWRWLREQPSWPFFRVLYIDPTSHLAQASPLYAGHPGLIVGVLVGDAFRNQPDTTDPEALRAVNVRYVVTAGALPSSLARGAVEVQRFGSQRVYELQGWDPAVVVGEGESAGARPRVVRFERERVAFEPAGARRVVVRRAYSPGWRAYADDRPIDITPLPVEGSARLRLMQLDLPEGARRAEIRYDGVVLPTALGIFLTTLGLALLALFAAWPRVPQARRDVLTAALARTKARVPPVLVRHAHLIVIALPVLALGAGMLRNASGHHFPFDLDAARVSLRDAAGAIEPGPASLDRVTQPVDGRLRSCIAAAPVRDRTLLVEWPEAPLRGSLRVGAGISDDMHGGGFGEPVLVRILVDGELRETLTVPNGRAWIETTLETQPGEHALRFEIDATDPHRRALCFDAIAR